MIEPLCRRLQVDSVVTRAACNAYDRVRSHVYEAQHQVKFAMLEHFANADLSSSDLTGSSGYGYDDAARDAYETLLAAVFGAQRALARLSIVSGTHAIVAALGACAPPGTAIVSATGRPYDTLRNAICEAPANLVSRGVEYVEIALAGDGGIDIDALLAALRDRDKSVVFIQRSRGYAPRRSLSVEEIGACIAALRAARSDVVVLVDNCYGELVETREPTHVGADLVMGSLIKNLGGSLAPGGGYIAGRADLVERVAHHLYAPGLGSALGPTFHFGCQFVQGLYLAPLVVEQVLRGLDFCAALFDELGYHVDPKPCAVRTDIVQALRLGTPEALQRFADGLQRAMPLDARFRPEPGAVPGYLDQVLMSSGAFVGGATIELSCDAPIREPYEVYVQGGVVAEQAFLGAILAAQSVCS